jgi:signal transduction histidine kinase
VRAGGNIREEMLMRRTRRSISIPIGVGVFSVALSIALLVGWILIIASAISDSEQVVRYAWLIALGSVSFAVIITTLVLFSVFLAREIRLVNRQTRFIDSVTHELKSPLASLKLCLQTQERGDLSTQQQKDLRQMMVDDVQRLSNFIDDVLEASQLSETRARHAADEVELRELVTRQAAEVTRCYRLPPDAIRTQVPEGLSLVTDRTALETIVKNLLDNAVKYSYDLDHPVEVTIEACRRGRHIHLSIRDRGIGIPHKHVKRVLERFYRVPEEAVRKRHGTGLGLYVVSVLVRLLGGTVRVESAVDEGTTMRIRIPTRRRDPVGAADTEPRFAEPSS